jgi:hypothetical protein
MVSSKNDDTYKNHEQILLEEVGGVFGVLYK